MIIYLYDDAVTLTGVLREYDACVTTRRLYEASTFDLRGADFATLDAATYLAVGADPELYRIEGLTLEGGVVTATGRSALVDLESRAVPTAVNSTGSTGALITAVLATFTGSRATALTAGDLSHGTTARRQVVGDDAYAQLREFAAGDGMGLRCRSGYVDLVVPTITDTYLGDALRNVGRSRYERTTQGWANYAYVVGTFSGTGYTVTVDQTSGGERRELYLDSTVEQGALTLAQWQAALAAEGAAALSERRLVEAVAAQTALQIEVGDVCWYDSGVYADWLLCQEVTTTYENGVTVSATLGEPPATVRKTIRRAR